MITPLDFTGGLGGTSGSAGTGATEGGALGEGGEGEGATGGGGTPALGGNGGATAGGRGGGAGEAGRGGDGATGGDGGSSATGGSSGDGGNGGTSGDGGSSGAGNGGTSGDGGSSGAGNGGVAGGGNAGMSGGGNAGSSGAGDGGTAGAPPTSCSMVDANAKAFGGHCYLLVTTPTTWPQARTACPARYAGGHLVTITSESEQMFVWQTVVLGGTEPWLGCTDGLTDMQAGDGSIFEWITGEDIQQYHGWAGGEPNNFMKTCPSGTGTCYEHCGFLQSLTQGYWNDEVCSANKASICEWDTGG